MKGIMRVAAVVLSLAASAGAAAAEPSVRAYRIHDVRFRGDLAFAPDVLANVLESLKVRRVIPGVWTRRPIYDVRAVDADLARLRSFYLSNGYFDAQVGIADVTFAGGGATVTLDARAGPRSRVRQVRIEGLFGEREQIGADASGEFPVDPLCACLLDARRAAETDGRLDFIVAVEVAPVDGEINVVDVTARVRMGTAHLVGRIEFSGHHGINESTLRRAMALQEGELFDVGQLRRDLARLNAFGLFEPLALTDVSIATNPDGVSADLMIPLRERPRRRWSLSGPVLPPGLGSLSASISSHLPAWGRGLFEASTYYVTFNLIGLANPLLRALPMASKARPSGLLVLERPYLPGQPLLSGFALSPALSPRAMLAHYGRTHLTRGVHAVLGGEPRDAMGVPVMTGGARNAGGDSELPAAALLICDPPSPRLWWLRHGALQAADLALAAWLPY
jgi:hypothetical protein